MVSRVDTMSMYTGRVKTRARPGFASIIKRSAPTETKLFSSITGSFPMEPSLVSGWCQYWLITRKRTARRRGSAVRTYRAHIKVGGSRWTGHRRWPRSHLLPLAFVPRANLPLQHRPPVVLLPLLRGHHDQLRLRHLHERVVSVHAAVLIVVVVIVEGRLVVVILGLIGLIVVRGGGSRVGLRDGTRHREVPA